MKRILLTLALILVSFAGGWIFACIRMQHQTSERLTRVKEEQAASIATIRQRIYGSNFFHEKGISSEDDARLDRLDPIASEGEIMLSYLGGLGRTDSHLVIHGNGRIRITDHGTSREVTRLDQRRCAEFFRRALTSGLLNYSDDVIEVKRDLARPDSISRRLHAPTTKISIRIPGLEIDKSFTLDPEIESRNFPDIVEYRQAAALEKEILSLIPKADPFWK